MTTRNYQGWKADIPDIRDLPFSAPRDVTVALPQSTNNRARFTSAVYDQGPIGSCGPHSCSADIQCDGDVAGHSLMPSRLFGYYVTRHLMGTVNMDSGVSNREMLKAYAQFGWCDESLWPYEPARFKVKPPQEAYDQGQERRIETYLRVPQQLDQMRACLASGDPFIFGFSVYTSFESDQTRRTGVVKMPDRLDRQLGGHDVLIVDYDDAKQRFTFRNSYGVGWGDRGFGYMPYQYATHPQLASDSWTIRWKVIPAPVPVPPVPVPVPDGVPFTRSYYRDADGREWEAEGNMRPVGTASFAQCPPGVLS